MRKPVGRLSSFKEQIEKDSRPDSLSSHDYYWDAMDESELNRMLTPKMTKYILQSPTPKQHAFLLLDCVDAFFGGAASPGKTSALLMAALQYVDYPEYSAVLIRDTYQNLIKQGSILDRAHEWLANTDARWDGDRKAYIFPSGAVLSFSYLDAPRDHLNHQSAEYHFVGIDEVVNIREHQALYMFSRLRRLKNCKIPIRFRCASNPPSAEQIAKGQWVKDRYVNPATRKAGVVFIPAKLSDNVFVDQEAYKRDSLSNLDEVTRLQLEEGDWEIQASGHMFDPAKLKEIDQMELPSRRFICRGWDLAASEDGDAAWTAGVKLSKSQDTGIWFIENALRFKSNPFLVRQNILSTAEVDGKRVKISLPQDPGQAGKSQVADYVKLLDGYDVHFSTESGSKIERANGFSCQVNNENVYIVRGQWNKDLKDEMLTFPFGKWLDMVDAISRAYSHIVTNSKRYMLHGAVIAPVCVGGSSMYNQMGADGVGDAHRGQLSKRNIYVSPVVGGGGSR